MSMIRALIVLLLVTAPACAAGEVKLEKSNERIVVTVDGKPFTTYIFEGRAKPILYPIHTPGGTPMTRRYPIEDAGPTEAKDHPHHASLWFTHGDVNGYSFWHIGKKTGTIVNDSVETDSDAIRSKNKWVADGKTLLTDETTIRFSASKDARTIDFTIKLIASEGDVKFGETKEGSMGIRSHPNLRLKGKSANGKALNSEGVSGKAVWGKDAKWVAYWGKVDDKPVGFAIFDHPSNPRHPTGWHARDYGLVAANPFGGYVFDKSKPKGSGTLNLKKGESLTLRYRFVFYTGEASAERIEKMYDGFAGAPK